MLKNRSQKNKKHFSYLVTLFFCVALLGLGYVAVIIFSPMVVLESEKKAVQEIIKTASPSQFSNRVYIEKIGVNVSLENVGQNQDLALLKGAAHRLPENGDPIQGGNFVVIAHRFSMGLTPQQTREKSPFFHIDRVVVGDTIHVDYQGKRYAYEVVEKKRVSPTAVEIEQRTTDPRLTLYTCDITGSDTGREVLVGRPLF